MEYELSDHDRAEMVKHFLRKYGFLILLLIIVTMIGFGVQNYLTTRNNQMNQKASIAYQTLLSNAEKGASPENTAAAATQIIHDYPDTVYASFAELNLADHAVSEHNLPLAANILKTDLKKNSGNDLAPIITLRLARVSLASGQFSETLQLLERPPKGFEASYALLRGDTHVALKDPNAARQDYQIALTHSDQNPLISRLVEARLSTLGSTS